MVNKLLFTDEEVQRGETVLLQTLDGHGGGLGIRNCWEELTIDNQLNGQESQVLQVVFHSLLKDYHRPQSN